MKNLEYIKSGKIKYIDYYSKIIDCKKDETKKGILNEVKVTLNKLKPKIEIDYEDYLNKFNMNSLEDLFDSSYKGNEKIHLIKAYSSKTKGLSELKAKIKSIQKDDLRNICPYCGILTPNSFDHYIPKDSYPEYAVLPLNLVPCCITCNGKKSEYWRENGQRTIINYYLDKLPEVEYLICNIRMIKNVPVVKFEIFNKHGIDKDTFSIIESHYDRLNLLHRFKDSSNDYITEVIDSVSSHSNPRSSNEIMDNLKSQCNKKSKRYGVNHWQCALLNGLSKSQDFCDFLFKMC